METQRGHSDITDVLHPEVGEIGHFNPSSNPEKVSLHFEMRIVAVSEEQWHDDKQTYWRAALVWME